MESARHYARMLAEHGFELRSLQPLAGDLSARRYHRAELGSGERVVLAVYPPGSRDECGRFLATGALLREVEVRVPAVLASDCAAGWTLLEDLGDCTLAEAPRAEKDALIAYFAHAVAILGRIQRVDPARLAALNPPLNEALLRRELEQTATEYLQPMGLLETVGASSCSQLLDWISRELDGTPRAACHRDFMVRNLMPVGPAPTLAVIDHQGLRVGPELYDLASLLNDTLFLREDSEERLIAVSGAAERREELHLAAAQRTLKAVGTYARFLRGGQDRHSELIAPTFERALSHLARLPETREISSALRRAWEPVRGRNDLLC